MNWPIRIGRRERNQAAILGFEGIWGVASGFVYISTILAAYLEHSGASKMLIGVPPAIFAVAGMLLQPLTARRIVPDARLFRRILRFYLVAPLGYIAIGISALLLPPAAGTARIGVVFAGLVLFTSLVSLGDPHYLGMVVDAVESRNRGSFFGLRLVMVAAGGLIGGALNWRLMRALPPDTAYGWSFIIGGVIFICSAAWFGLYQYQPPATDNEPRRVEPSFGMAAMVFDPRLRAVWICVVLFVIAQSASPLAAISIKEALHTSAAFMGKLTAVQMLNTLAFAPACGYLGDRYGHRPIMAACITVYGVGLFGIGHLTANMPAGLLFYFLQAIWFPATTVVIYNFVFEAAESANPAKLWAVLTVVSAPGRTIGPVLAGACADRFGFAPTFDGCLVVCGLALAAAFWRQRPPMPVSAISAADA